MALVSTHVDEDAHFPVADEEGNLSAIWALHQMIVTKDFSTNSKLANFCMEDLPIMSHIIFFLALGIPTIHILLLL
ncbi:hypothetical protein [Flavobacterium cheongpyeongense]|uniref:hypothetical protein n=1 Tax=Flavobacterium cheongpyeongense TaxID=2212651 RepID=UPI001E3BD055|nr:hypothetical protein [Flavobacterium cheongpyeongense]